MTTRFGYDGDSLIAEYDVMNALLRRYVHGPGADAPLVWYEGNGTTNRRWLIPDERGSIVAVTDDTGAAIAVNSYDPYGIPALTNLGRFQYTGQTWIPELGIYNYKARIYSATLGRFMQTDPIGYGDGMNMYAYVGNDPVNYTDPLGLFQECDMRSRLPGDIGVCGQREDPCKQFGNACYGPASIAPPDGGIPGGSGGRDPIEDAPEIVVTAKVQCPAVALRRGIGTTGLGGAAAGDPKGFVTALRVYNLAHAAADKRYSSSDNRHGQFRHVYAASMLTRLMGTSRALLFLNAGEVYAKNEMPDRVQDNYNNDLGISLAQNVANRFMSVERLAEVALSQGCVR